MEYWWILEADMLWVFIWAPCYACTRLWDCLHMKEVKEIMLNIESRASNQAPCSSNPVEEVASLDLIPPGIAVICSEGVHFQYHCLIRQISYPLRTGGNSIQLDLCKHKGKQGDGPHTKQWPQYPPKMVNLVGLYIFGSSPTPLAQHLKSTKTPPYASWIKEL